MQFNHDNYIHVPAGIYSIGLDDKVVINILETNDDQLKSDYIYASYPSREIEQQEFYIAKKIVSLKEFTEFMNSTNYITDAEKEGWGWTWINGWKKIEGLSWKKPFNSFLDDEYRDNEDVLPVLQVSWNDALAYCQWLTCVYGFSYRLPAESEWEIFASFFEKVPPLKGISSLTVEEYFTSLKQICTKNSLITPTGLVWEWTADWYDRYPGGKPNKDFGNVYRVLRGGSLMSTETQKIKEYRFRRCPTARSPFYGFRLCT